MRTDTMRPVVTVGLLVVLTGANARAGAADTPPDHPLLPRALEVEWALSAAPAHLRDGAAVLVLTAAGYVQDRAGTNAFTCVVNRRGGDVFPVCWDAEGARTLMAADIEATRLRLAGQSVAAAEQAIDETYRTARRTAPARPGVAYLLSPLRVRIDANGVAARTPAVPHAMFYAPNLTDADIGGVRGGMAFINKVGPDGMIIVPVGSAERQAIVNESKALIDSVARELRVSER